jgi:hypothetical protein
MNKTGLKPCPFCGREINTYEMEMESGKGITYLNIRCECGVEVEIDSFGMEVFSHSGRRFIGDTALDIWNRRTAGGEDDE